VIVTKDSETAEDIAVPACIAEDVESLVCGYHLTQIKPIDLHGRYLFRLFQSKGFSAQFTVAANGVTRFGLPQHAIANAFAPLPPFEEQQIIARFLDFKTAQIDALIAQKQTLLDKLAEKRTALISHAVTKGLNSSVPMKDSGVAWLGEIPAHWQAKRTKFSVSYIGSGKTPKGGSEVYVQEGIMILRSQNVHDDGLRLDDVAYITDEADAAQSASRVLAGDVLLNITGASIGRASIVPSPFPQANVNQHVCILRPIRSLVTPQYLHLLLCSRQAKDQISSLENGTSREGLNFPQVGGLLFAFPPVSEQIKIVAAMSTKVDAIDLQFEKITSVIDRLVEYRSAVITNAVTGKIDVRNTPIDEIAEA
jgi:type I restriction enzyme S subunit